ncbi:PA2169 family four-helix-bundle protein [Antarcticibacterium arcticum]|uniref:PA2169 family four-helix-bundle protein n=1 Tax=Antarcticibacterium arcticum TaxID=2585771 RepID=A0A5B8YLH1_9FLAO|nr:PA2169 family four-helix-bundle protein [Antarcticibacterium arcticum]QED38772.1 PA2169 family four-helix-bundle protein [Antarcticibacterium arcticum]
MKYAEEVADKLNNLLEKNYDTEKGYKYAAENVENPELKSFFNERAQERYDFGHELKSEIRNFGESPEKGSSFTGDVMRSWMNLKSHISPNKEEAILEETIRGEKAAVEEYNEVMKDVDMPPSTQNVLMKQRNAITAALNKVQSLELRASNK